MGFRVLECLLLDVLKKKGIKKAEYARKIGISRQYVQKLVNNQSVMSIEIMINSCHILDCELKDLYRIIFQKEGE